MKKNVQIPVPIFCKLVYFHLMNHKEYAKDIAEYLDEKLESLERHELYTTYKRDADEAKREDARLQYLDLRGVPESFRY